MEANSQQVEPQQEAPQQEVTQDVPSFEAAIDKEIAEPQGATFEEIIGVTEQEPGQVPVPPTVAPQGNDQVRYQYWQSEAAKLQNQLAERDEILKQQTPVIEYVTQNPQVLNGSVQAPQAAQQVQEAQKEEDFPPPPQKPQTPAGYSREDAFQDATSESAKYDSQVEQWRDDMQTYNQLHTSYQVATMQETHDREISELRKYEQMRQQDARQRSELDNATRYVKSRYDLGGDHNLNRFVNEMNDPNSINMDDLVGYWKHKNGIVDSGPMPVQNSPQQSQPSQTFQQLKRGQSVPTPMGVQTSAGNQAADPSNNFMASLINEEKRSNLL